MTGDAKQAVKEEPEGDLDGPISGLSRKPLKKEELIPKDERDDDNTPLALSKAQKKRPSISPKVEKQDPEDDEDEKPLKKKKVLKKTPKPESVKKELDSEEEEEDGKLSKMTPRSKGKKRVGLAVETATVGVPYYVEFAMPRHHHIMQLFVQSEMSYVFLSEQFSSEFVREFYRYLEDPSQTGLDGGVQSQVQGHNVTITHEDLRVVFGLTEHPHKLDIVEKFRAERDWTQLNLVLHQRACRSLINSVATLTLDALAVQDVLRHTILLKLGDTAKITAQLSLVSYFILVEERFDVADLLLSLIRYTYKLQDPSRQRHNNLPLGGIIQRVILQKYPTIENGFYLIDCFPTQYSTTSLRATSLPDEPSSSTRSPLRRGASVRETRDDSFERYRDDVGQRFTQVEEEVSKVRWEVGVVKKEVFDIKKMIKYMIKALMLNPSSPEQREWDSPTEDPPRHSIRRSRRHRSATPSVEEVEEAE